MKSGRLFMQSVEDNLDEQKCDCKIFNNKVIKVLWRDDDDENILMALKYVNEKILSDLFVVDLKTSPFLV